MRPMSDENYQAEMDMHTMKAAEEIEMNPKRAARARNLAMRRAEELMAFAKGEDMSEEGQMTRNGYRKIG